jgi:putative sugar O-methyltransferase
MAADNINKKPFLDNFPESQYGNPVEQFTFNENKYSRSSLNYILGLCFVKKNIADTDQIKTVLEIGGGFGTLGEILSYTDGMKYINVDIPPMSFIAWQYLSNIYHESKIGHCVHEIRTHTIDELPPCNVFNSWDIENIEGDIDLFVNFISFQEMEPNIVENYLLHIRRLRPKFILLRNIREGKQVKKRPDDVGVETPILTDDYINMIKDSHSLIASSVIPYGYKTADGFHSELLLFQNINE